MAYDSAPWLPRLLWGQLGLGAFRGFAFDAWAQFLSQMAFQSGVTFREISYGASPAARTRCSGPHLAQKAPRPRNLGESDQERARNLAFPTGALLEVV